MALGRSLALYFGVLGLLLSACATAPRLPTAGSFMAQGDPVAAPSGFVEMCRSDPAECVRSAALETPSPRVPALTPDHWALLEKVNHNANQRIRSVSDERLYGVPERWTDPLAGHLDSRNFIAAGDCEDFALAKRDMLLEAGWPADAMFIAVGYHVQLGPHAVLVARTDRGDFVLDSRTPWITPWTQTPYLWVKRQLAANSTSWVRAFAPPAVLTASRQLAAQSATAALLAQTQDGGPPSGAPGS